MHNSQKITATVANSALRVDMEALEPEQEGAPARSLWYKPMAWLGVLRPLSQAESWSAPLWQTFFTKVPKTKVETKVKLSSLIEYHPLPLLSTVKLSRIPAPYERS